MSTILVIDDDRQITRMLRASLQSSGYTVLVANDGMQALDLLGKGRPDLVITDLAMPAMDGLELTRAIRNVSRCPIIVLSVRNADTMKITALDTGADDYLTKPFSMPELLARVRAQLRRRSEPASPAPPTQVGDFLVNAEAHTATFRGEELHLSPKEFQLLSLLLQHTDRVVGHKFLLRSIWGAAAEEQPEYLRVLVGQLRKKLDGNGLRYIRSEPWVGYRLYPSGAGE